MTRTCTLSVSPGRKAGMSERSDCLSSASRVFIGGPSSSSYGLRTRPRARNDAAAGDPGGCWRARGRGSPLTPTCQVLQTGIGPGEPALGLLGIQALQDPSIVLVETTFRQPGQEIGAPAGRALESLVTPPAVD